jgi:hypothetical protein
VILDRAEPSGSAHSFVQRIPMPLGSARKRLKKHGPKRMTLADAKNTLRPLGIRITKTEYDEYRVSRQGREKTAYYTDDLRDAVETGKVMGK